MQFKPGDYKNSVVTDNVYYLFLFKSPSNSSKFIQLAKQVSPYDNKFIVKSLKNAIIHPFSYLFLNFHPTPPEKNQFRSKVFRC